MKDTRERQRDLFRNAGLSYSDIEDREIQQLIEILEHELGKFNNNSFRMRLCALRKKDIRRNPDKSIIAMYLMVDGAVDGEKPYFRRREAISFNRGGFIGFAGWADDKNVQPFLDSFESWVGLISRPYD